MKDDVRVYRDPIDGYQVWLELDVKFSGMCIGVGRTADEARASAVRHLQEVITALSAQTDQEHTT